MSLVSAATRPGFFADSYPNNFDDAVLAIAEYEGCVVVGGKFFSGGLGDTYCIARMENNEWRELDGGLWGRIFYDVLGGVLAVLSVTGIYMYFRVRHRRRW